MTEKITITKLSEVPSDHSWSYCERVAGLQSAEHSIEGLRVSRLRPWTALL
jgi:hypothetical protein